MQGSDIQLTFVKYNFTYVSQFQALGLQGEASYWFAGSIQTSVTRMPLLRMHVNAQTHRMCLAACEASC